MNVKSLLINGQHICAKLYTLQIWESFRTFSLKLGTLARVNIKQMLSRLKFCRLWFLLIPQAFIVQVSPHQSSTWKLEAIFLTVSSNVLHFPVRVSHPVSSIYIPSVGTIFSSHSSKSQASSDMTQICTSSAGFSCHCETSLSGCLLHIR